MKLARYRYGQRPALPISALTAETTGSFLRHDGSRPPAAEPPGEAERRRARRKQQKKSRKRGR
jgi:hypothetical protein